MTTPRHLTATVCTTLWVGLVVGSILLTARRDAAPGDPGAPPTDWPASTSLAPLADGWTLVMQAHAKCPCTVASLDELDRLLKDAGDRPLRAYVLVVCPAGAAPDFADGSALDHARALDGVVVVVDAEGREAARFGARTSGHVSLFDPAGRLRFAGGLTPSRGHRGDGPGRGSILSLLTGDGDAPAAAPVFGCPLQQEGS